ncbi:MAG: hypothetical protein AAFQ19_09295 [Pseudomonadota bacterium]
MANAQPAFESVDEAVSEARREIARLSAVLTRDEAQFQAELNAAETALSRGNTVSQVTEDIGLARRFLPEHSLVQQMDGRCQRTFSQLNGRQQISEALRCVNDLPIEVPIALPYQCSSLRMIVSGSRMRLVGFVAQDADHTDLATRFGQAATRDVEVRPWPVCKALETITLPSTMVSAPTVRLLSDQKVVRFGESLAFDVVTPSIPSFTYIAYLQADDSVINLAPRQGPLRQQHAANQRLRFGDGQVDPRVFTAAPPAGPEAIVVVSARSPIEGLEDLETGSDGQYRTANGQLISRQIYLAQLDAALTEMPENVIGERELSADLVYIRVTN